ncbi:Uncharacterised protein [BD1-7 clade bacterium]|uniref:Uncharacterized protein n=1 Tax=BD1-7 clade bacterium TaxID=2029982 RepID=A0A5S9QQG0_9GAMM|nr:Uncharacterised protein [BD1-7 clade bacterium]
MKKLVGIVLITVIASLSATAYFVELPLGFFRADSELYGNQVLHEKLNAQSMVLQHVVPIQVDDVTSLSQVHVDNNALIFEYALNNSTDAGSYGKTLQKNSAVLATALQRQTCQAPSLAELINLGGKVVYNYADAGGVVLAHITINGGSCSAHAPAASLSKAS